MIAYIRYLLLLSGSLFSYLYASSQHQPAAGIYTLILQTEQSSLPDKSKLAELLRIKQKAERDGFIDDTGYYLCLVKTAKYESIVNSDKQTAITYSLEALRISRLLPAKPKRELLINNYFNLATYCQDLQHENNALAYYDTTLILCGANDPDDYILLSHYQRTYIYFNLGDFQKVIEESTSGLAEARRRNELYYTSCFLNFRASAFLYQNRAAEAFADVEKALQAGKDITSQYGQFERANSYKVKGQLYQKLKDYKKAEFYYQQAIAIRPHDFSLLHNLAIDYNDAGNFYLNSTNNISKATASYLKTITIAGSLDNERRSILLAMAYENLGEACCRSGKLQEALKYYQLACKAKGIDVNNFLFDEIPLTKLSAIEYKDIVYALIFGKTKLLFEFYKVTKQASYLEACMKAAVVAEAYITQARHENIGEGSKLYWRNETRDFFNTVIEASYYLHDNSMAYYLMEKSRAVLLTDKWNELKSVSLLTPEDAHKEEVLRIKIVEEQQALSALPPSGEKHDNAEYGLLQSRSEFEHFTRFLEKKYPLYYQSKYADKILSLNEVQNDLGKKAQSFVYYFSGDSATYILSITGGKTDFIKVDTTDFDKRCLSDFVYICSDKQMLNSNYQRYISLSQTIYAKLFQPLHLPKGNVAICTDNFFIPFEALCTDAKGRRFLLSDYSFSYAYSAQSFLKPYIFQCRPEGNFAGFAPVSFSSSLKVFPLMHSSDAIANAGRFYNVRSLFTNQQASRHNFITQASRYSVVTVFSHAQADTTGREPVLYMQDSLIHLSELQKLDNPAIQFILLSACQTNIGKNATGEGIYSLARGFSAAGIPAVSATLWKADEETIYQISEKFNKNLSGGMDKSDALREAKLWYLQNNDREHTLPYYWANLVLIGSSNPVVFSSSSAYSSSIMWIIIVCILAVIAFVLIYKYKRKKPDKQERLQTIID